MWFYAVEPHCTLRNLPIYVNFVELIVAKARNQRELVIKIQCCSPRGHGLGLEAPRGPEKRS
jgi:hypothetical protein